MKEQVFIRIDALNEKSFEYNDELPNPKEFFERFSKEIAHMLDSVASKKEHKNDEIHIYAEMIYHSPKSDNGKEFFEFQGGKNLFYIGTEEMAKDYFDYVSRNDSHFFDPTETETEILRKDDMVVFPVAKKTQNPVCHTFSEVFSVDMDQNVSFVPFKSSWNASEIESVGDIIRYLEAVAERVYEKYAEAEEEI